MLLVHACGRCHLNFAVIPVSLLGVLLCIETISIDFFLYAILIHITKGQKILIRYCQLGFSVL